MDFLVSAYGCEPNKGSEPGIGWQWCLQLARFGEVHIITRSNNKENIDTGLSYLSQDVRDKLQFYYYDTSKIIRSIKKGDHNLYPYYFCWQIGAYNLAKKLCKTNKFDYCFALTFGSIWMPTFMYKLPIPFVWGPIGGGEAVPDEYLELMGKKSSILQRFRKIMIKTVRINPLVINPIKKAKYVIARTEDTAKLVPCKYSNKVKVCLETAIDLGEIKPKAYELREPTSISNKMTKKVKYVFTGRFVDFKGLDIAFRAIAESKYKDNLELILIGSGGKTEYYKALCKQLGIERLVTFAGKMKRSDLLEQLKQCDVYLCPSFREGGSWSLMEGMGAGLPVICIDTSGMHIITDDNCAVRIPVSSIDETVSGFSKAIDKLIMYDDLREKMGQEARQRIELEFNWDSKGNFLKDKIFN